MTTIGNEVSSEGSFYSDEAKRASDILNGYRTFTPWDELQNKWVAIRLSDGGHDGTLYDSKQDAVRAQLNEFQCAYVCFRNLVGGASPREMEIFLKFNRDAYDKGFRLVDPDAPTGGMDIAPDAASIDYYKKEIINDIMRRRSMRRRSR